MNRNELQIALRKANAMGLNLTTLQVLVAVSLAYRTKDEVCKQTGSNQAWKCATTSPLFEFQDGKAYLSDKGEEKLSKILKEPK